MLTVNTAAGHRGPVLVGHGVVKANAEEGMEHRQRKRERRPEMGNWKGGKGYHLARALETRKENALGKIVNLDKKRQ